MRKPNHIVLDFESNSQLNSSQYWALNFLAKNSSSPDFLQDLDVYKKYQPVFNWNKNHSMLTDQQKFTTRFSNTHQTEFVKSWEKDGITKIFKPTTSVDPRSTKHFLKYSQSVGRDAYMYVNSSKDEYHYHNLKCLFFKYSNSNYTNLSALNTWFNLVNVNLLRKERLYTKLKYSRSPAFDIVSGGAAAILAGFIGFLISEKFGYELVDSGDFYYLFMYLVFLSFSIRPLLTVSDAAKGFWDSFSLKRVFMFYTTILSFFLRKFK